MYPLIKISNKSQHRFFCICIGIICILISIYFILSAAELQLNSYILHSNTEAVEKDNTKVKVEHINEEGTLYLYDTTTVKDDEISSYIRTEQGSGVYYIPDGQMAAEITKSDALALGKRFMILDVCILLGSLCFLVWKRGSKRASILLVIYYGLATLVSDIVFKYYCVNTLKTPFPIQWVIIGRFLLFFVLVVIIYRKFRTIKN